MSRDFICLMCPNGCHLITTLKSDGAVEVVGNRCDKGLGFARNVLKSEGLKPVGRIISGKARPSYPQATLREIAKFWGISLKAIRTNLIPEGSPERTVFRVVLEDEDKRFFTLEEIVPGSYHNKMRIIRTLESLSQKGMGKIAPYRLGAEEQYIQKYTEGFWQLVPFVPGVALDRERYLYEGWRAKGLSAFLIELRQKTLGDPFFSQDKSFSMKTYIYTLLHQIERHHPQIMPRVKEVVLFLGKGFMSVFDGLPVSFCHGDFHPLNMIWGKDDLHAVIDWEFSGVKPEVYDAANMVGCLGMEHPSSLISDLVVNFIRDLKAANLFSGNSWEHFLEFVIALRFAWLSEWLRKNDEEMISLELDYMELLIQEREQFYRAWK
ncbi:MAG: phosphotransferase [Candidatus Omnitrophica bacterium]|nr:phosphotransferase [Candidatus Omnitrophota bacterium]